MKSAHINDGSSKNQPRIGDFSDRRVFVCRPGDSRLAQIWPETGGFEQAAEGPTYIVVGKETDYATCAKLAARFNLSTVDLIEFGNYGRTFR